MKKGKAENPAMGLVTKLADYFGISVSYLVGKQVDAQSEDVQISRMFRQAKNLDVHDLKILDDMMQSLLKRQSGGGSDPR